MYVARMMQRLVFLCPIWSMMVPLLTMTLSHHDGISATDEERADHERSLAATVQLDVTAYERNLAVKKLLWEQCEEANRSLDPIVHLQDQLESDFETIKQHPETLTMDLLIKLDLYANVYFLIERHLKVDEENYLNASGLGLSAEKFAYAFAHKVKEFMRLLLSSPDLLPESIRDSAKDVFERRLFAFFK